MSIVLATQVICAAVFSSSGDTLLDPDTVRQWDIVVADTATEAEQYAAREFRSLFAEASGVELPLRNAPRETSGHVFIGPDVVKDAPGDLGGEDLHLHIAPDRIDITGGRPRGTLYGVYEFFEKHLGVRFLTHDHTHVPPLRPGLRIPVGRYTYRPPLTFRDAYYKENRVHPEFAVRKRVNTVAADAGLGGMCRQRLISHTFLNQLPTSKYGKDHPEYFALHEGKRLNRVAHDGFGSEPCLTNPQVLDIVTDHVLAEIAAHPGRKNFSVSQNDNDKYCQCATCGAIDEREGTPMGSLLTFVNGVAERVEARHPDVMIGTLAYWYTRKPPKTLRPRRNVQVQLCSIECCTVHPIDDPQCPKNVAFARDLAAWKELTDQIWIWNYNVNFRQFDLPHPNLRVIGPNVRLFVRSHARGIFMQADVHSVSGEMSDLRNYMIAGLLWHPSRSGEALREEFLDLHYRSAAPAVRAYLEVIYDNAEAKGVHPACFPNATEVGLDPSIAAQGLDLFRHAMSLADDDVVRGRVERASICAYRGMLEGGVTRRFEDDVLKPVFPARFGDVVAKYVEVTKKYGLTALDEGGPIDSFYDRLGKNADGQPASRLENEVWRVTLLPERNGKIIELFHKPSGHHFVEGILSHRLVFGFDQGIDEWALAGYGHNGPWAFVADGTERTVHLAKTLAHGARLERTIRLSADPPGLIHVKTVLTHRGNPGHTYQFFVRCDFSGPIDVSDSGGVEAYVKSDRWHRAAGEVGGGESESARLWRAPDAEAVALFNPAEKAGLAIRFDSAKTERARLPRKSAYHRTDLEVVTERFRLNPEQAFEYEYTMEFLADAPGQ